APTLFRSHLVETKLAPARLGGLDIVRRRPDGRRVACAAEFGIGVVVEVDGRVDQHPVPLAGPIERRIAVAFAGRWIEAQAEGRRYDDDVVLAGIDPIGDRPIDGRVVVNIDVIVDHSDVLVTHVRGGAAPNRVGGLLGLSAIGLLHADEQVGARTNGRAPY